MKIRHLIIVGLILAIFAIGAVSASADDANITAETEDVVVESSVDDVELSTDDAGDVVCDEEDPVDDGGKIENYSYSVHLEDAVEETSFTCTVVLPDDATGDITAQIDDYDVKTGEIWDGHAYFVFAFNRNSGFYEPESYDLPTGTHTMKINYTGDEKYAGFACEKTFSYDCIAINFPNEVEKYMDYDEGENAMIKVSRSISGQITVWFDDEVHINGSAEDLKCYFSPGEEGYYYIPIHFDNLPFGEHTYNVTYEGDHIVSKSGNFNVTYPMEVSSDDSDDDGNMISAYGEEAYIDVRLPYDAKSNITVVFNGRTLEYKSKGGYTTIQLDGAAYGINNLTVKYQDDQYPLKTIDTILIVKGEIHVPEDGYADTYLCYGTDETVSLELPSDALGNLVIYRTYFDDGIYCEDFFADVPLVDGKAVYSLNTLAIGEHRFTVKYLNGTYGGIADRSFYIAINPVIKYNKSVELNANESLVLGFPEGENGTVTVTWVKLDYEDCPIDEPSEIFSGTASSEVNIPLDTSSTGSYYIYVSYINGDKKIEETRLIFNVINASRDWNPDINIQSEYSLNDEIGFYDNRPEGYRGYYSLYINGEEYSSGKVAFDEDIYYYCHELGTFQWEIRFYGDSYFNNQSQNGTFDVTWALVPEVVEIGGQSQYIRVILPGKSGDVVLSLNGNVYMSETLEDGEATFDLGGLTQGATYTYEISYPGGNMTKSGSFNVSYVIKVSVDGEFDEEVCIYYGETNDLYVVLPADATGTVIVTVANRTYSGELENGRVIIPVHLDYSLNEVLVNYTGDEKYSAKTTTQTFGVDSAKVIGNVSADGKSGFISILLPLDAGGDLIIRDYDWNVVKSVKLENGYAIVYMDECVFKPGCYGIEAYYAETEEEVYYAEPYYRQLTVEPEMSITKELLENEACNIIIYLPEATDSMEIYVDGELNGTYSIVDGILNATLSDLSVGDHIITFRYLGWEYSSLFQYFDEDDYEYYPIEYPVVVLSNDAFTVKFTAQSDVIALSSNEAVISIYCPVGKNGSLFVNSVEVPVTAEMTGQWTNFTLGQLGIATIGDHGISVTYGDDAIYEGSVKTTDSFDLEAYPGSGNALIVVLPNDDTIDRTFSGTVTVMITSEDLSEPIVQEIAVNNGFANVSFELADGDYEAFLSFVYDDVPYTVNAVNFTVAKKQAPATWTVAAGNVYEGQDVIVDVTINDEATGTVTVDINGRQETADIVEGSAAITISGLTADEYTLNVTYSGDENFLGETKTVSFTVRPKVDVEWIVEVSADSVYVGQDVVVSVEISPDAYGDVSINGETIPIDLWGKGNYTFSGLEANEYNFVVTFGGDDKYNADAKNVSFTVMPKADAGLSVSAASVYVGQDAVISIEINPEITGGVTVNGETVVIADGKANFTVSGLAAGDYTYAVAYAGDVKFNADAKNVSFAVMPKADAGLSVSASDVYVGQDVVVNVLINENVTGAVTVNGETVAINNGKGTYTFSNLAVGDYTYAVAYAGDVKFNAETKNVSFAVMPKVDAGLTVTVSADSVYVGQDVVVNVLINENVTGAVTVNGETIAVNNGTGTYTFSNLAAGDYTYSVAYAGDVKYNADAKNVSFTVMPKVDAGLSVSAASVYAGQDVVVNVLINENVTGAVTVNGETVAINNGKGTYTFSNLAAGNYTYNVAFAGDVKFDADTKQVSFEVMPKVANNMTVSVADVYIGNKAVAAISFAEPFTGSVFITSPKANVTVSIANGKGSYSMSGLAAGEYIISVRFDGTEKYLPASANATFKVLEYDPVIVADDYSMYYNHGSYSVTVYGKDGKVASKQSVVFKVNGAKIGTVKTNSKGVATIKIDKLPKTYKITSEAFGKAVTKKLTVKQVLKLKAVTIKKSAKKLKLQATLKEGKKALNGKKITFIFNGKKVKTVKTNSKGIAKVTLKKALYSKLKVGKKVTYKATYIKDTVKKTTKVKK